MPAPKDLKKRMLWIKKLSKAHKGKVPWNKDKKGFCGENSNFWKGGKIEIKCQLPGCNNVREVYPSDIKSGRGKYCSHKCRGLAKRKRFKKICLQCGKEFETSCKDKKYCKGKCYYIFKIGENNPNWQNGISFEPYTSKFNKQLKELIRFRDSYFCQKCGLLEIDNGQRLSIHHIDYVKKNCLPSNLISLCRICNKIVNFNRSKWEKYFINKIRNETYNKNQLNLKIITK